jgi:hypothetical protein
VKLRFDGQRASVATRESSAVFRADLPSRSLAAVAARRAPGYRRTAPDRDLNVEKQVDALLSTLGLEIRQLITGLNAVACCCTLAKKSSNAGALFRAPQEPGVWGRSRPHR